MSNRLQGKDFISIGIYTAIYFVVNFIVSLLGFIPIFIPLTAVLVPLIGGIPMMLYFTKIKKFGMLTITGLLIGVLMLLTGMGYWCIITCVVFALITEFILKGSGYKSAKMEILAHGVFSIWTIGAFIPIKTNTLIKPWRISFSSAIVITPTWSNLAELITPMHL